MAILYAASYPRRAWQLVGDAAFVLWALASFGVARIVHATISELGELGVALRDSAGRASDEVAIAADRVDSLPLVGPQVAGPLGQAAQALSELAAVGAEQVGTIDALAWWTALALFGGPVAFAAALWLPWRVRFMRRAAATRDLAATGVDLDLFALRALATQPIARLRAISDDPVRAWRTGDAQVVSALAELELADCGVRAR